MHDIQHTSLTAVRFDPGQNHLGQKSRNYPVAALDAPSAAYPQRYASEGATTQLAQFRLPPSGLGDFGLRLCRIFLTCTSCTRRKIRLRLASKSPQPNGHVIVGQTLKRRLLYLSPSSAGFHDLRVPRRMCRIWTSFSLIQNRIR